MDELLERILEFAAACPAVRAVILTGSHARDVMPADTLSDIDLELFVADRTPFAALDRWLAEQADVLIDFDPARDSAAFDHGEPPRFGDQEAGARLVVFDGGQKVDLSLIPMRDLEERVRTGADEQSSWRGYRVLLDRDGLASRLPPAEGRPRRRPPTPDRFDTLVREYWFETYHVAKYLARGDLWPARFRDSSAKRLMLTMLEWHACTAGGWDLDTWHLGAHLRDWAAPGVWERVHSTFAGFDAQSGWHALERSSGLFRMVATETAERLGYDYPRTVDRAVASFVESLRKSGESAGLASGVTIRRATLQDHAAVRTLQMDLDREHAAALPDVLVGPDPEDDDFAEAVLNQARCFMGVAEVRGAVVGFVDASWHEPDQATESVRPWCRINNLAVLPEQRRRGIATALVRAAEEWALEHDLPDVRLDVYEFNADARRLYERLGYQAYRQQMRRLLRPRARE